MQTWNRIKRSKTRFLRSGGIALLFLIGAGFAFSNDVEFSTERFFNRFLDNKILAEDAAPSEAVIEVSNGSFSFKDLDIHPDNLYNLYATAPRGSFAADSFGEKISGLYKDLLSAYSVRQGVDDNFTLRATDTRTGGLLGIVTLDSLRMQYDALGTIDWRNVDRARRTRTGELVDSLEETGIDRKYISVKWGRKNQVLEARQREVPFIEYEVKLARFFDLSLLATEIGTVETFNTDRVVSRVGARSRYQIMPSTLRDLDINHYKLDVRTGKSISVYEEWNPLIAMEASMLLVRAYSNAVGHETPGISAYHTGPFNVFHLFRTYLESNADREVSNVTTELAYLWGITSGYEQISSNSSFKGYSRGYIPSNYGSLRATDELLIDTTLTVLAERLQMQDGEQIYLSELLGAIGEHAPDAEWRTEASDSSLYLKFRTLNNHIALPEPEDEYVPVDGDILITRFSKGKPVRIFLPRGTSKRLASAGMNLFDPEATFDFAHDTFVTAHAKEVTAWDERYRELVDEAYHFGFSEANRERLFELVDKFEELAELRPTYYRKTQLAIIKQHQWIWRSREFTSLVEAIERWPANTPDKESVPYINGVTSLSPQPIGSPISDSP